MPQQMGQKEDGFFFTNSFVEDLEVEIPDCHSRSDGNGFPVEMVLQHRGLTPWGPSATTVGALAQPAFVDEDDRAPLFLGFFLRSGQVFRFQ